MTSRLLTTTVLDGPASSWAYRPHLDGLRTVAVYAVVLYHAGLAGAVGGFVGVDLFFVLSGYLVTNVLLSDLAGNGTVRLVRFYARRARRLIPAAAIAVVGISAASLMLMPWLDRSRFVGDARAGSLWYANWHFLRESSDYFAVDGPESPFIHFWSLSIEEQFYLAFPLTLLLLWKLRPRLAVLMAAVSATLIASLALQVVLARDDVNRAYLGTDARVYQILGGGLLAMVFWRWDPGALITARASVRRWVHAGTLGALVAFGYVASSLFDVTVSNRGLAATAASLATVGGLEIGGASAVTGLLAWRPIRYLGQISYGTYLWHWPVLVLAHTVVDMSPIAAACVSAVVGTALAALSAELLEVPIRTARVLDAFQRHVVASGVVVALLSGALAAPLLLDWDRRPVILPRRGAAPAVALGAVPDADWEAIAANTPAVPRCSEPDGSDCFVSSGDSGTILMIGDSHARMLIPTLMQVAAARDMALAVDFSHSCPWQDGLLAGEPGDQFSPRCAVRRPITYGERVAALDPDLIVLVGFPRSSDFGEVYTDRDTLDDLDREALVSRTTTATLQALADSGRRVLIVEPMPVLPNNPLSCLSGAADIGECSFAPFDEGSEEALERELAAQLDAVATIDLDDDICPGEISCPALIDGVIVHRDRHHLTPEFAVTLVDRLGAAVDDSLATG